MEVHFTPEQEAHLTQIAAKAGTDAGQFVKNAVLRLIQDERQIHSLASELPEWDLGAVGSFHRRDLYDDGR